MINSSCPVKHGKVIVKLQLILFLVSSQVISLDGFSGMMDATDNPKPQAQSLPDQSQISKPKAQRSMPKVQSPKAPSFKKVQLQNLKPSFNFAFKRIYIPTPVPTYITASE